MKKTLTLVLVLSMCGICEISAQTLASENLRALPTATLVTYNIGAEGERQPVKWGIDTAYLWSWWPLRATNHMQECVALGRVTIDPRVSGTYTALSDDQKNRLNDQTSWLKKSGVTELELLAGNTSGTAWQTSYRTSFIKDLELAVKYLQSLGYSVTYISPFNEPDYSVNNAPSASEMATVAGLIRQNATMKNIDIMGPSTLNPDYAVSWWNTMKNNITVGNTHQLAGTFDNFAGYYDMVKSAGKPSAGDEMHNTGDALIGMHRGMSVGVWWSDYGGYTRAELGRASNDGSCIGYSESSSTFTATAVFRRDSEHLTEIFIGSSERQAAAQNYNFVSADRLVYYDGNGPYYEYLSGTPGGNGYSSGQTNAESTIEVTYGEDVSVGPLTGNFQIVNKATGKALTSAALSSNATVSQAAAGKVRNQTWTISPVAQEWDFAYSYIQLAYDKSLYLDGVKYGGDNGARVLVYSGGGNECECWHLHHKGGGWYVITNRDSGLSLEASSDNTDQTNTQVVQWARTGSDRQLWRLIPEGADVETDAPAAPEGLRAELRSGSVLLSWNENQEQDLLGYMIYRYNDVSKEWETIARQVVGTSFLDNMASKASALKYRIRAVDKSWNVGEASEEVVANENENDNENDNDNRELIAHYPMLEDVNDDSENMLHGAINGGTFGTADTHVAVKLDGEDDYIALPYHLGDLKEMTFSAWVKASSTTAWQRLFDFGCSTENYMMLTNSNGSVMRFEICKDGEKQGLNAKRRLPIVAWNLVTLTIGKDGVKLYLNGTLNAETTDITLRPCDVSPNLSFIGRSMYAADPLFKGMIGDVRIYNYALSAEEVAGLCYADVLDNATQLAEKPMYSGTREALLAALNEAKAKIASGTADEISAAVTALSAASKGAQTSIAVYQQLGDALAWSAQLAADYPQEDVDAQGIYTAAYSQAQQDYTEGTWPDSEVAEAVIQVQALTNTYLMADFTHTASEKAVKDISHLLTNADFSAGTTGWTLTTQSSSDYSGDVQYGCFEVWNHNFSLSQSLCGMPQGKYRLQIQGFYRNGAKTNASSTEVNTQLFVGDTESAIMPISKGAASNADGDGDWYKYATGRYVPNDMQAAAYAFNTLGKYKPIAILSQNTLDAEYDPTESDWLTFGLRKTTAVGDDWTILNYVKLSYMGGGETGISYVENVENAENADKLYNLAGQKVGNDFKGVVIIGGKKMHMK